MRIIKEAGPPSYQLGGEGRYNSQLEAAMKAAVLCTHFFLRERSILFISNILLF